MLQLPSQKKPITIDIFRALSATAHQYDLPFNYLGTVISTNFKYQSFNTNMTTLGTKNGYEFLWKEAEANLPAPLAQFTFLNDRSFYTISSAIKDTAKVYFTRTGANDPNFNLRRDPSYILRSNGTNKTFINVIEIHGNYSAEAEVAGAAYSSVSAVTTLQDDENYTAIEVTVANKKLFIVQANKNFDSNANHTLKINGTDIKWTGPYQVLYNAKKL